MVFLGGDIEFHLFYLEDFIGKILEFAFRFRFGLLAGCEDETDKVRNTEKSKLFHHETFFGYPTIQLSNESRFGIRFVIIDAKLVFPVACRKNFSCKTAP